MDSIEIKQPEELASFLERATYNGFVRAAEEVQKVAKEEAPQVTGNLRKSITVPEITPRGQYPISAIIPATATYALFVHEGTGIYNLQGKGRPTPWVYYSKDAGHFVRTRGQKPNPFFRRAVKDARSRISDIFEKAIIETKL